MQHCGIEFAGDRALLLNEQSFDCKVPNPHAKYLRGGLPGFIRRSGALDASGLAALARGHLRLDHARPEFGGCHGRLGRICAENTLRHRDASGPQNQRLGRVLLEVHHQLSLTLH
jgi:hypothetical protein